MDIRTIDLYEYTGLPRTGREGRLDCYAFATDPEISTTRRRPAILVLPGGGYWRTSHREGETVALQFAARGYAAFVLYYTCHPAPFPIALREACMAMRYIRENADGYEIDPAQVAAVGFSAGGHLCATLGTMYGCPETADIAGTDLLRPDAIGLSYPVLLTWGPTHEKTCEHISGNDPDLRSRMSLEKQVHKDMPPVFLWHTRDDQLVPVRNSLLFANALADAGVDFAMHIYRHGKHGLSNANDLVYKSYALPDISWDVPQWIESMHRFFGECGFGIRDTKECL